MAQSIETHEQIRPSSVATFLPWLLLPTLLIIFDQLLKLAMVAWIGPDADQHHVNLVGDFLSFEYVENTGAAFGILSSATGVLAGISLLIALGGGFMLWKEHREHPLATVAIGLVIGGAIGNVIDRIYRGYVVDFVAVGEFPRFNLADSAISIGVILLLVAMVRDDRELRTKAREGTPTSDG